MTGGRASLPPRLFVTLPKAQTKVRPGVKICSVPMLLEGSRRLATLPAYASHPQTAFFAKKLESSVEQGMRLVTTSTRLPMRRCRPGPKDCISPFQALCRGQWKAQHPRWSNTHRRASSDKFPDGAGRLSPVLADNGTRGTHCATVIHFQLGDSRIVWRPI